MPLDNARLVIDLGNQWPKERSVAPFFGVPAWWRRFMFYAEILTSRDLAVYLYICSVMDPNAIAYPAIEQIQEDMGIKSRSIVIESIDRLVDRGFLLKSGVPHYGRLIGKRTVFQRPSPQFTLLALLRANERRGPLIDHDLFPIAAVQGRGDDVDRKKLASASDEVVEAGLKKLLGQVAYNVYARMATPERKMRALVSTLETQLKESQTDALAKTVVSKLFGLRPQDLQDLPPDLAQLVEEDEEDREAARPAVPF